MFVVGAQCGLTPYQVLDMSLPMFQAVVEGYQDHVFDLECIAVSTGYWSGYYSGAKHPRPLSKVLQELSQKHEKAKHRTAGIAKPKPEVDVEAFLERERKFQERSDSLGRR